MKTSLQDNGFVAEFWGGETLEIVSDPSIGAWTRVTVEYLPKTSVLRVGTEKVATEVKKFAGITREMEQK